MYLGNIDNSQQDSSEFTAKLQKFVEDSVDLFSDKLIGDLSHINSRAECHTGISFDEFYKSCEGTYQLDYSYDWSVYNGCADMDESERVIESTLVYVDGDGEVEIDIPEFEEKSTVEEF